MDVRQQKKSPIQTPTSPQDNTNVDIQNITNIAVYNLMKRKSLYSELYYQFKKQALVKLPNSFSFLTIYSYKPPLYIFCAGLAHMYTRKFSFAWLFVHVSAFLFINHWDINQGAQKINPQKWQQYKEASKNYQLALSMQKVSLWKQVYKFLSQKLTTQDYERVLHFRPH